MYPSEPLRLCTHHGCTAPRHYENCPDCWGFGVYDDNVSTPVSASAATDPLVDKLTYAGAHPDRKAIPCPTCKSTVAGAPAP
jgi:hypothetical protein